VSAKKFWYYLYNALLNKSKSIILDIPEKLCESKLDHDSQQSPYFQSTLIVEIRTLVVWLKSSLLLKIECWDSHICMKTKCLQTKWNATFLGGKGKDRCCTNLKFNSCES